MKVALYGSRSFGRAVGEMLLNRGHVICSVVGPRREDDALRMWAEERGLPAYEEGAEPADVAEDAVIVAAHSHYKIPPEVLRYARVAVGYHPSLLPLHRGKTAVQDSVAAGDPVLGATVYHLTNAMDGGPIALQQALIGFSGDRDASNLWREGFFPLGVEMLTRAVNLLQQDQLPAAPQEVVGAGGLSKNEFWCRSIIRTILREPHVGVDDEFLDAGGDSMRLMQLFAVVSDAFPDAGVGLAELRKSASARSLAALLTA